MHYVLRKRLEKLNIGPITTNVSEVSIGEITGPILINGCLLFLPPDKKGIWKITNLNTQATFKGALNGAYASNDANMEAFDGDVMYPGQIKEGHCLGITTKTGKKHNEISVMPINKIEKLRYLI